MKKHAYTFGSKLLLTVLFVLFFACCLHSQSKPKTLAKIKELRSAPHFNEQTKEHIDLLLKEANKRITSRKDSALVLINEAYTLSTKADYSTGKTLALSYFGRYYGIKENRKKEQAYYAKAFALIDKHGLGEVKINILNTMGIDLWHQGKNAQALNSYLEALQLAQQVKDSLYISKLNSNIALLYIDNKDYDTALTFLKKAERMSLLQNNEPSLGGALVNMAVVYKNKDSLSLAEKYVDKAQQLFEKQNIPIWVSYCYEVKGDIAYKRKNYQSALEWFTKAKNRFDSIEYTYGYRVTYIGLAKTYLALNNTDLAIDYAQKALKLGGTCNVLETRKEANHILAKSYQKLGNIEKAYAFQEAFLKDFEKMSEEDYKKGLGILKSKMQFEKQREKILVEKEAALAEQQQYIYMSAMTLLGLLIFVIMVFRTNRIQRKCTLALQVKHNNLLQREAALQKANTAKDKLFSVISHDLKGPVQSLIALLDIYEEGGLNKRTFTELLPKASLEIKNISAMLNNLLIWGKAQVLGEEINKTNIDMYSLAKANIQLAQPVAFKKKITIVNNIVKNTISFSSKDSIDIVLRNLLSNALKFTNAGGEIVLDAIEKEHNLIILIKDNGLGMGVKTQKNLFDKTQANTTLGTNNEKGTGLGLSFCKDLVEHNGGKIWVESVPNKGTTVCFTVPFKGYMQIAS